MPVETLSTYSDWSHVAAVALYLLATALYFVEQAFSRAGAKAAAAKVLVGAGGPDVTAPQEEQPPEEQRRDVAGRSERFGRMAVSVTVLGALVHLASLALRGLAAERVPWGNMYEYISVLCLGAVAVWLMLLRKFPVRHLGGFVLAPVALLMFIGGALLYSTAAPVDPPLQSYWLVIHVFTVATSSGALLVPGVASVLYLIKSRPDRFAALAARLPSTETLDRVAYRITIVAFPVYTLAIIFGAIWAEAAWSRFWGWDPKETCAFVAWVVYAAYLHSRATAGWRGTRAAAINALGFAVMVFNLFFVNLVISGLHSYAGLG